MTASGNVLETQRSGERTAILLLLARLALVALATVIGWLVVTALTGRTGFPPDPMIATLGLLPVNLASLWLVARMLRAEGSSMRDILAYQPGTWRRETAWALLWVTVLFVPFIAGIMGTTWMLHGVDMFVAFETMFYEPDAAPTMSAGLMLVLGIIAFVTFAPLNAPTEELLYRGYAQSRLLRVWPTAATVLTCSLVFGLQHAFFAPTRSAVAAYVVAFTLWGIGSALIVLRQRRLMPIVIAHLIVNLMTSAPAVAVPILMVAGVIDVAG